MEIILSNSEYNFIKNNLKKNLDDIFTLNFKEFFANNNFLKSSFIFNLTTQGPQFNIAIGICSVIIFFLTPLDIQSFLDVLLTLPFLCFV